MMDRTLDRRMVAAGVAGIGCKCFCSLDNTDYVGVLKVGVVETAFYDIVLAIELLGRNARPNGLEVQRRLIERLIRADLGERERLFGCMWVHCHQIGVHLRMGCRKCHTARSGLRVWPHNGLQLLGSIQEDIDKQIHLDYSSNHKSMVNVSIR